jgi:hypothetical protein
MLRPGHSGAAKQCDVAGPTICLGEGTRLSWPTCKAHHHQLSARMLVDKGPWADTTSACLSTQHLHGVSHHRCFHQSFPQVDPISSSNPTLTRATRVARPRAFFNVSSRPLWPVFPDERGPRCWAIAPAGHASSLSGQCFALDFMALSLCSIAWDCLI